MMGDTVWTQIQPKCLQKLLLGGGTMILLYKRINFMLTFMCRISFQHIDTKYSIKQFKEKYIFKAYFFMISYT